MEGVVKCAFLTENRSYLENDKRHGEGY